MRLALNVTNLLPHHLLAGLVGEFLLIYHLATMKIAFLFAFTAKLFL